MNRLAFVAVQHQELRRRLREADPDLDEETLADTVEGLTDLHDIVRAIVRSALLDQAFASGLRQRIEEMQARLTRFEDRVSKRRQIVRDVMVESDIKKITAPDFTISIRPGTPGLIVVDEATIPAQFWEPRDPRLNRLAVLNELKAGEAIPGAALSNPEPVLSVRAK
jgi:hypothetical protein